MKRTSALFDVDGTLTTVRVWMGLMEYFKLHGVRRATHYGFWMYHFPLYILKQLKLISESAFRGPWAAHLAWYVRGCRPEDARAIWDWVISVYMKSYWRSDVTQLLDRHKDDGDIIVLVSGGPAPMLDRIAREVGADYVVGTVFEIQDGSYTGRIVPPVNIGANKPRLTRSLFRDKDIDIDYLNSFVYADSISDVALMELVGNPVATYPDDGLRDVALDREWRIFPDMYKIDDYS